MLTPEYLLRVSEGSEEIASELHTRILKKVIKRVMARKADGDDYMLTAIDKWQLDTLQEAGYLLEDIQQEISKYTGYQAKEVARAMEDAGITALKWDDKIYKQVGIDTPPLEQSPHMIRLMQREYEKTMGTWENFTGTTANATHQAFIDTMDEIHIEVMAGETGYIQAYQNAIDKLCDKGLTVTYPSGHTDTLETAALRCVRTGVAQATAEIQIERMNEEGQDLVLVSSHEGARPSHQEWQGKIYSRGANLDRYPDFVKSTHYGEGNGLCGWNCRHHFSPYIEGMRNPFEDYSNEENVKLYEETQEQRRQERNIRKTKRAIEGYKEEIDSLSPDDPMMEKAKERLKEQKNKLKRQNAEYKAYCKEKGFKELPERLRIAKARKSGDEYNLPDILDIKPVGKPTDELLRQNPKPEPAKEEKPPKMEPATIEKEKKESRGDAERAFEPIKPTEPPEKPTIAFGPSEGTNVPREQERPSTVVLEPITWKPREDLVGTKEDTEDFVSLVNENDDISLKHVISAWAENIKFIKTKFEDSQYGWFKHDLHWGITPYSNSDSAYSDMAHELGHSLDQFMDSINAGTYEVRDAITRALLTSGRGGELYAPRKAPSQSDEFMEALEKDIQNITNGTAIITPGWKHCIEDGRDCLSVSDLIDGAFGGFDPKAKEAKQNSIGIALVAGHGDAYWDCGFNYFKRIDGRIDETLRILSESGINMTEDELKTKLRRYETAIELWANISRAVIISPDSDFELQSLERFAPNSLRAYRKIMGQHADTLQQNRENGVEPNDIPRKPAFGIDGGNVTQQRHSESWLKLVRERAKELVEKYINRHTKKG